MWTNAQAQLSTVRQAVWCQVTNSKLSKLHPPIKFGSVYRYLNPHLQLYDRSSCMLGLRPKLKPRPSLLDLIATQKQKGFSTPPQPHPLSPDDEVAFYDIPLPASPTRDPPPPSYIRSITVAEKSAKMAPSKKQEKEDDNEQLGQVFSVSGPVIVAANMLGCAMYELVGHLESFQYVLCY